MKWSKGFASEAIVVVTGAFLIFQNCSQPMEQVEMPTTADGLDFAFQTDMDTLAYLSCKGDQAQSLWTFKLGAYGQNSGVWITPSFFYDTENYSDAERVGLLSNSGENSGATIQVALRYINLKQNIVHPEGTSPTEGKEYATLLTSLTDPRVSQPLISALSKPLYYFPQLGVGHDRMEASLRFNNLDVTDALKGTARLMVTYRSNYTDRPYLARGPGNSVGESAYGRSLRLQFIGVDNPPRILSTAQENDLLTGSPVSGVWNCPANLRLRVGKRPEECTSKLDGDPVNTADPARLARIRQVLSINEWAVNLEQNCILQRVTPTQCYRSPTEPGDHYFSMCFRNL